MGKICIDKHKSGVEARRNPARPGNLNQEGTMATDNIPGTAKKESNEMDYNIPGTEETFRRSAITLYMDERVMTKLRFMAYRENTTITSLISEALATYLKWMKKAELEEQAIEKAEKTKQELEEAGLLLDVIIRERKLRSKQKRAKELYARRHPGIMSTVEIKRRNRRLAKKDNV
jgi:hypothetical protein